MNNKLFTSLCAAPVAAMAIQIGAWVGGPGQSPQPTKENVRAFQDLQDAHLDLISYFAVFDVDDWKRVQVYADIAKENGSTLVVTWMPKGYSAQDIVNGKVAYILGFKQLIGTDGYPSPLNADEVSYVGDASYATLYDTTTGYTLNGDIKAYAAVLNNTWLDLSEIGNEVPAGNAVVLKGTYYNKLAADLPAINIANDLKGTDADTAADGTMYILANGADGVGFYKAEGTIPAGKAYFQSTSGVKAFFFDGDDATGISLMEDGRSQMEDGAIYNIAGQRIQKMQKGINIINGKKVLF